MTAARRGIGLSCALALVGCAWSAAPTPEAVDACARDQAPLEGGVVGRDGAGRLSIDGVAVLPRGVGSYPLLEHAGNGRMEAVHDVFDQAIALGRPVVRTNAYLDGGRNPARIREADGALRDEGLLGLDRLLAAAAERGVRLVLILTNNWQDYGGATAVLEAVAPSEGLPKDAFWSEPRAVEAQRRYLQTLVARTNQVNDRS